MDDGIFDKLPKKEISKLTKEWKKLDLTLIGIKNMQNLPSAIFIVDPVNEKTAVDESRRLKIPIVAICDTNSDPDVVDYCIPGNDDAIKSINLLVSVIADAVLEGKAAIKTEGTQISVEEKYSSDEQIPMTEAAENKEVVVSQENVPEKQ